MARNFTQGETVYVPCSRLKELPDMGVALYRTKVAEVQGKTIKVDLLGGVSSEWIGASLCHRDVGILIINVGDLESEHTLLDPLAKSIKQFCRLMVPDDQLRSIRVRSVEELVTFWHKEQSVYSHVIWIGHASQNGLKFGVDGAVEAKILKEKLRVHGAPKKTYISLCCKTGFRSFGGETSEAAICSSFIGPFNAVEGAIASQFCQTFLTRHLLSGETVGVAFKHARLSVPGSTSFRYWAAGKLKAGPK